MTVQTFDSLHLLVQETFFINYGADYSRRQHSMMSLHTQAYLLAGYDGGPCAFCFDNEVPKPLPRGWMEVVGEDEVEIYYDGDRRARMVTSCRGGAFHASLWVAPRTEPGTQHGELNMYADNTLPHWRAQL